MYRCLPSALNKEEGKIIDLHSEFLQLEEEERNWKKAVVKSQELLNKLNAPK